MGRQLQREESTYALRPPKYGSERVIYLPDELVTILSEHVETHIGDADPELWLFIVSNDPMYDIADTWRWRATWRAASCVVVLAFGVAPIPANSGQVTTRYRLNRYGDRQLDNALHTVVQSRIQYQPATCDYVARRTAEGKTGREIKRRLACYVARDLYRLLENTATAA